MQATAKSDSGSMVIADDNQTVVTDENDSEYVGKHRPRRMSLRRSRARVARLTERNEATPAK